MTSQQATTFSDSEHVLLDCILDQIIPASSDGNIPGAGALGVTQFLSARVCASKDLQRLFRRGLDETGKLASEHGTSFVELDQVQKISLLQTLEQREPEFFQALLRHTYMGYYIDSTIRPLFGLSAKPTQPDGYEVAPDDPDEMEKLLQPVINRGNCFRDCD